MKYRIAILTLLFALFCCTPAVQAGFWVKKHTAAAVSTGSSTRPATATASPMELFRQAKTLHMDNKAHHQDNSGWEGIVALVCGIVGLFTFYLAIPAIIFGVIGLGHNKEHRGMALAGLILGAVAIIVWALLVLAYSGALWW